MTPEFWTAVIIIPVFFLAMVLATRTPPSNHEDPTRAQLLRGPDFVIRLDSVDSIAIRDLGSASELRWVCIFGLGGSCHQILCENLDEAKELTLLLSTLLEYRRPCDINGSWGELEAL